MEFSLRNLKASDMGAVCKILSGIGVKKFKDCFTVEAMSDLKDKKNIERIGMNVVFDIGGIIIENIPSVQKDIDVFLASLTGCTIKEIQELSLADYGELIITVIQKDEFKDFFNRVMKSFNP